MSRPRLSQRHLNYVLIVVAAAGWIWALHQKSESRQHTTAPARERPEPKSSQRSRNGTGGGTLASVVVNPRSADLLNRLDEILASGRPGVPNEAFVTACRAALLDPDFENRTRDIGFLVEAMRPEDAPAIHQLFARLHQENGIGFPMEYAAFARAWGALDPTGALDYLNTTNQGNTPDFDIANILGGWAEKDPGAALKWIKDHPEAAEKNIYANFIDSWMHFDQDAATDFLVSGSIPPNQLYGCVFDCANHVLYGGDGADASVAWLAALPDEERLAGPASRAWDITSSNYGELDCDHAAKLWSQVADKPWMSFRQFERFSGASANARTNPEGLDGFIDALSDTWPADRAAKQFASWAEQDPRVHTWLRSAPEGEWINQIRGSVPESVPQSTPSSQPSR